MYIYIYIYIYIIRQLELLPGPDGTLNPQSKKGGGYR